MFKKRSKIFINYRRDDERAQAARIRDRLAYWHWRRNIFMDIDNLKPGQRFDAELEHALTKARVFLAIIGPRWMELLNSRQQSGERDYVREEIAAALDGDVIVIPVLLDGATLQTSQDLPEGSRQIVM